MNNNMADNIQAHISANKLNNHRVDMTKINPQVSHSEDDIKEMPSESMQILGALGEAQVNMNNVTNSIKKSVEDLTKDFDYASTYTDFCDSLIDEGYSLKQAVEITDEVFRELKGKNIYS